MEESRLVMLTCAKGALKAANIAPREALPKSACLEQSHPGCHAYVLTCALS